MQVQVVDYSAPDAAEKFVKSLHETSFGVLINYLVKQSLVESIYKNWQEFFLSEEKHSFAFDPEKQDGYFSADISETAKSLSSIFSIFARKTFLRHAHNYLIFR